MAKAGFRKSSLGSPWGTEVHGPMPLDPPGRDRYEDGPRVGPGVEGKRIEMEVSRDRGRGMRKGSADAE